MPETQTHTVIANKERCLHSPQTPREIWFVRFLGIYFPCHWKGIAAMAAVIIPSVIAIMLGEKALAALGYRDLDWLAFLVFWLPAFVSLTAIAKRHC